MYFKIKKEILFRKYDEYGFLTDNKMFGYRMLDDKSFMPGERYVSDVGAVMLSVLSNEPMHIDDIVDYLMKIFVGVDADTLKSDTVEFFSNLVDEGFLCSGESPEECSDGFLIDSVNDNMNESGVIVEKCSKDIFKQTDFLRSIHIEVANECNERCVHCYIPHEYKLHTIDSALFYKILEEGRKKNIINVTLSGGEPLIHREIVPFLKKCRELNLSVNVLTNLTLLTDEIKMEMKRNPLLSVQTSIYSMDPGVHDAITSVSGSLEKTKAAVIELLEEEIPVQISCPIMKQNKDSFESVVEWGRNHNIGVATDYVIFAAYDHMNSNLTSRISVADAEDCIKKQLSKEYVTQLLEVAGEKCSVSCDSPVCSICRYYFCVSAEGDAYPCIGWQMNKIGNLNVDSISDIWEKSEAVKNLREITWKRFPKCIECKDRGFCTVCMMNNSNESKDGNPFAINDFHCRIAEILHKTVDAYLVMNGNE